MSNPSLKESDPVMYDLVAKERERQFNCVELIASENFTSKAVMECLGSCLTNKYSEGMPGARYYGGNEFIDQIENLCRDRALEAFRLNPDYWGVNVQPYSGSPANFAAYTAILKPHDRIMGLDLPSGGHLTHGYYTAKKSISATSIYFESLPYRVNDATGLIDYDELERTALVFRPKLLICGASAYPRDFDYARFREIADKVGAYLLMDMAHISGLVATGQANSPFEYCDIVTSTTHKSLRGPRAGVIFFRKGLKSQEEGKPPVYYDFEEAVNFSVFPSLQGGPHNHQIGGLATALKEAAQPGFKEYIAQVKKNAKALADYLMSKGYKMVSDGTDNHLVLWDLRPNGLTGSKMQVVFEKCGMTLNKNAVHGDKSAMVPGGVRVGAPAFTTRGAKEADFVQIGEYLHRGVEIALAIQEKHGKKLVDFEKGMQDNADMIALKESVSKFAAGFFMPGVGY